MRYQQPLVDARSTEYVSRATISIVIGSWIILVLALAASAQASPTVSLGHYYVKRNTVQSVALAVSDAGNPASEDIEGMTFTLQLGTGNGVTPSISAIDFLNSSIWSGHVSPQNIVPLSGATGPQFKSFGLITDAAGDFINASGTLANISFNTAGAAASDYALSMTGTLDPGLDSQFTNGLGNPVSAAYASGMLTVVAPGDFDRNGQVTVADVSAMMTALADLSAYKTNRGLTDAALSLIGDLNGDGQVTNTDIQSLIVLLANGGNASISTVPEPSSLWLGLLGLSGLSLLILLRESIIEWSIKLESAPLNTLCE